MDEETARSDVEKLRELLDRTTSKSKKQKEKTEEQHITFENLEQYPYIMQQSAWELDWDKVQALYSFCIGIPAFIIDDSIVAQWSPTASPSSPQQWTDSEDFGHFICPCGVAFIDAIESTRCGGGARAGQLWE